MSTRSLTVVIHENEKPLLCMYRHCDGYPTGHGKELKDFLKGMRIVNGIVTRKGNTANGMGCLAAQIVAHFKDGIGGVYLYPTDTQEAGQDYTYTISTYMDEADLTRRVLLKIENSLGTIYKGPIAEADMDAIELAVNSD